MVKFETGCSNAATVWSAAPVSLRHQRTLLSDPTLPPPSACLCRVQQAMLMQNSRDICSSHKRKVVEHVEVIIVMLGLGIAPLSDLLRRCIPIDPPARHPRDETDSKLPNTARSQR